MNWSYVFGSFVGACARELNDLSDERVDLPVVAHAVSVDEESHLHYGVVLGHRDFEYRPETPLPLIKLIFRGSRKDSDFGFRAFVYFSYAFSEIADDILLGKLANCMTLSISNIIISFSRHFFTI